MKHAWLFVVGAPLLLTGCGPSVEDRIDQHLDSAARCTETAEGLAAEVARMREQPGFPFEPGTRAAVRLHRHEALVLEYRSQAEGQASAALALAAAHYEETDPRRTVVRRRAEQVLPR